MPSPKQILEQYVSPDRLEGRLGGGINGEVYATNRRTAVKVFEHRDAYERELAAYKRLRYKGVREVLGFNVPQLIECHKEFKVLEITFMQRPFLLDFAQITMDEPPENVWGSEWKEGYIEKIYEEHDERASEVFHVYNMLYRSTGIYHLDLSPRNIQFARDQ